MKYLLLIIFVLLLTCNTYASCEGTDENFIEWVNSNHRGEIFTATVQSYKYDTISNIYFINVIVDTVFFGVEREKNVWIWAGHGEMRDKIKGKRWLIYAIYNDYSCFYHACSECDLRSKQISNIDSELKIIREMSNIINNRKTKQVVFYYDNDKIAAKGNYLEGKPNGYWENYYESGTLKNKSNYKNGNVVPEYTGYYKNSNIEIYTKDSMYSAKYYELYNGKIQYEIIGQHPNYQMKYFYINGNLKSIESYGENCKNGVHKLFYENGQIQEEGNYLKNAKIGIWKYYSENGELINQFDTKINDPTLSNISINRLFEGYRISAIMTSENNYEIKLVAKNINGRDHTLTERIFSIILPTYPKANFSYKTMYPTIDKKIPDGCVVLIIEESNNNSEQYWGSPDQNIVFESNEIFIFLNSSHIKFTKNEKDKPLIIGANIYLKK